MKSTGMAAYSPVVIDQRNFTPTTDTFNPIDLQPNPAFADGTQTTTLSHDVMQNIIDGGFPFSAHIWWSELRTKRKAAL
jgi:hypothetical protein